MSYQRADACHPLGVSGHAYARIISVDDVYGVAFRRSGVSQW